VVVWVVVGLAFLALTAGVDFGFDVACALDFELLVVFDLLLEFELVPLLDVPLDFELPWDPVDF